MRTTTRGTIRLLMATAFLGCAGVAAAQQSGPGAAALPAPRPTPAETVGDATPAIDLTALPANTLRAAVGNVAAPHESLELAAELERFRSMDSLPPPVLELQVASGCKANPSWRLRSTDRPSRWATVPAGRLQLTILLPLPLTADHIELTLNGKPLDVRVDVVDGLSQVQLPCPSVGRHVLQGRYLSLEKWSAVSAPLRLEVRRPRRPQIEAVADDQGALQPAGPTITVRSDVVRLRLSHVEPAGEVFAYLNGQQAARVRLDNDCCLDVPLRQHVAPGVHSLSVRATGCQGCCELASEASKPVRIHYLGAARDHVLFREKAGRSSTMRLDAPAPAPQEIPSTPHPAPVPRPGVPLGRATATPDTAAQMPTDGRTYPVALWQASQAAAGLDADTLEPPLEGDEPEFFEPRENTMLRGAAGKPVDETQAMRDAVKGLPALTQFDLNSTYDQTRSAIAASKRREEELRRQLNLETSVQDNLGGIKQVLEEQVKLYQALAEQRAGVVLQPASPSYEMIVDQWQLEEDRAERRLAMMAYRPFTQLTAEVEAPSPNRTWVHTFTAPASFPRRGFGDRGQSFDRQGLLIYEGMSLEVDYETGAYELRYATSAPPSPAHLELQLRLRTEDGAWHTLTIPPICIPAAAKDCVNPMRRDYRGTSELLRHCRRIVEIQRTGVARFGYGSEAK